MPLDAITLRHLAAEQNSLLAGCRIDKIFQPSKLEIYFSVRVRGENTRLFFSFDNQPRVYLSSAKRENP